MSKKCPKNAEKLSGGTLKHTFRTFFGQFCLFGSRLFFGDPVQCSPVTSLLSLIGFAMIRGQSVCEMMRVLVRKPELQGHPCRKRGEKILSVFFWGGGEFWAVNKMFRKVPVK